MLFTGAFDPGRGCASPSGLWATRLLLTGAFDPGRGCAGPSGLCSHKIAIYRGLRPRQRVRRPFGPMRPQDCYLPGPSTPAEGVPALRAYGATRCYLPGPSTPAEGVPALRAYAATRCYLPMRNVPRAALRSALGYLLLPLRGGRIDG
jgi:hypothetical protein